MLLFIFIIFANTIEYRLNQFLNRSYCLLICTIDIIILLNASRQSNICLSSIDFSPTVTLIFTLTVFLKSNSKFLLFIACLGTFIHNWNNHYNISIPGRRKYEWIFKARLKRSKLINRRTWILWRGVVRRQWRHIY